jgi:hypothetical protein
MYFSVAGLSVLLRYIIVINYFIFYQVKYNHHMRNLIIQYYIDTKQYSHPNYNNLGPNDMERYSRYSFEKYGTYYNKTYTIVLECLFVYNKNEMVKIYGKLGASRHSFSQRVETVDPTAWSESINNNYYAGQLTPIAVEIGKEISGFAELGFGYNGILSAGIRGKF